MTRSVFGLCKELLKKNGSENFSNIQDYVNGNSYQGTNPKELGRVLRRNRIFERCPDTIDSVKHRKMSVWRLKKES